jgi:hypothetical protein
MTTTRDSEGVAAGVHKPEEKVPFGEYAKASWASCVERDSGVRRGEVGRHGQTWVGRARPQEEFNGKIDF